MLTQKWIVCEKLTKTSIREKSEYATLEDKNIQLLKML